MSIIRAYISNVQTYFSRLELAKKIRLMLLLVSLIPLACLFVCCCLSDQFFYYSQPDKRTDPGKSGAVGKQCGKLLANL